ncbi:hypothetical protein ACFC07_21740 [Streptomyces sp. NPDC056099]|uniref:hypothetical protein n=1 Tax=unclassified Streptomyces TaxID=2593676 RepID=UPI0035E0AC5B
MPSSVPPLPDLIRYTRWDQVPAGLHTRTQLGRMDPPLKPGADPVGQVLYNGNSYAPLYEQSTAVPKRRPSPAQRAVLDRARELQHQCRRCGVIEEDPLGKGRFCDPCRYAMTMWDQHEQAQALARELVADPDAVLLVVDVETGSLPEAQGVAVVSVHDGQVLYAAPAGEYGSPERASVLDRLDSLLADRRVVEEPDHMGPIRRYPQALLRLPNSGPVASGRDPLHSWAAHHSAANASVARIWAPWYAFTDYPYSTHPCIPEHGAAVPWSRSLDVAADGQSMAGVLHRIADGSEPVWERAAWTLDGHGVGLAEVSA